MHVKYNTKGTCAVRIEFDVEDGVVKNVAFLGGCDGNHKGIAALVEGQKPEEVAKKLKGITCGRRTKLPRPAGAGTGGFYEKSVKNSRKTINQTGKNSKKPENNGLFRIFG